MEEAAKCVHEPRRPAVIAEKVPRTWHFFRVAALKSIEVDWALGALRVALAARGYLYRTNPQRAPGLGLGRF